MNEARTKGSLLEAERPVHAEAEIEYIPPESGGRRHPVVSGYRGQLYYNGHDWDAIQSFLVESVPFGESVPVRLWLASPDAHRDHLKPGTIFLVREGSHTVGYGHITKILGL